MRNKIFASVAATAMLVGCGETRQHMGGSVDNDQNVLTGGPITGTTLQDLPQSVKETLKERVPHAEIASIDRTKSQGEVVYEISFVEPDKTPKMYLSDDGQVLASPAKAQQ
jgi:hypothetical protein